MTSQTDPPSGWATWTDEDGGRLILAFRPDVFDAERYPPPCLPTVHVSNGPTRRRPGARGRPTDRWHVTLRLEPEVRVGDQTEYDSCESAREAARDLARRFDAGEVDYRDAYQVLEGRRAYLDRLDELTGRN
jgi:hypothetical protein